MKTYEGVTYSPAIRTRRAELKGLQEVINPFERGLLPLFELTRSRRTKASPDGSIEVSANEVKDLCKDELFAVDLTSQDSLLNSQIENLLNPDDGFREWRDFIRREMPANAVPVAHLTAPFDPDSLSEQVRDFSGRHSHVAIRVPSEFTEIDALFASLQPFANEGFLLIYADVGMVTPRAAVGARVRVMEVADKLLRLNPGFISPLASSFPSSVTPYGDEYGEFDLLEVGISEVMREEYGYIVNCIHGDYACIHPLDMEGMAINWVPRVDVPLDDSLYYYRYRRHDGGYVRAAKAALSDPKYVDLGSWADKNLAEAARGAPQGKSPSHWISVRLNYHIERQLHRLSD